MKKRLSIITVCYNSEQTIEKTFNSILSQTVKPFEYIVVDGSSTDKTLSIIQEYKNKFSDKSISFKYISEKDKGLYDAMNKGLFMAEGDWIHFLNSDDQYYDNNILEKITPFIDNKYDVVYGNVVLLFENGDLKVQKPKGLSRKYSMYFKCPVFQPAAIVKTEILKKYGFDSKYKNSADYKLWVQLITDKAFFYYKDISITIFKTGGASTNLSKMNNENIHFFNELKLYFGSFVHMLYFHMYILDFMKHKTPKLHSTIKRVLRRN